MAAKTLTEREWDRFAELVDRIDEMPGTWQEKRDRVRAELTAREAHIAWFEILGWFDDD